MPTVAVLTTPRSCGTPAASSLVNGRRAGSVALFGASQATASGGEGLTFVLEITKIVDELHLNNELDVDSLDVRVVPLNPVPEEAKVSIGRISLFRQGK